MLSKELRTLIEVMQDLADLNEICEISLQEELNILDNAISFLEKVQRNEIDLVQELLQMKNDAIEQDEFENSEFCGEEKE